MHTLYTVWQSTMARFFFSYWKHRAWVQSKSSREFEDRAFSYTIQPKGAFTLAGYKISVFASRSKSWEFYKCGHKNLTNYRDQQHAANCKKSCDNLGISAIICIAADVWTLEQIILAFFAWQGQGLYSRLISIRHAQFG